MLLPFIFFYSFTFPVHILIIKQKLRTYPPGLSYTADKIIIKLTWYTLTFRRKRGFLLVVLSWTDTEMIFTKNYQHACFCRQKPIY